MKGASVCVGVSMICLCPASPRIAHRNRTRALARFLAAAMLLAAPVGQAAAADWLDDTLRGSSGSSSNVPMRWDGLNFGATMGMSTLNADYGSSTSSQVAYTLRNTTLENE